MHLQCMPLSINILQAATSGFVSEEKADEIENFFKENPWPVANNIIKRNCEAIRIKANWWKRESKSIEEWLASSSTEQSTKV